MKSFAKTTLLLGALTGLFLAVGYMLGGRSGAIIALLLATVMNFGMYWFSGSMVLKMQRAVPLDVKAYPHVEKAVKELTVKDNLPMPKLYFVDSPIPNAFATGRSPKHAVVAVTRGITEILNERELRAVIAHELGHVKNYDMLVSTIAAAVGGAISILAEMAFWGGSLFGGSDEEGNNWAGSIAMLILAPFAAMLIQMAVSRSREFGADEHGAHLIGHGGDLASALQKLEDFKPNMAGLQPRPNDQATAHLMFTNMFSMRGLSNLFSTHPSTAARIERLRQFR
ncbi:zinc metalloprotease HtpX [Candidatus Saccharibacteria bacterium]|nr:MAG: zinc metalloprotease HtpX [Candidatus Saccharibacteria bacterium]